MWVFGSIQVHGRLVMECYLLDHPAHLNCHDLQALLEGHLSREVVLLRIVFPAVAQI